MNHPRDLGQLTWHSASCNNGGCIEIAHWRDRILIRDSKETGGLTLSFSEAEWITFVEGIREGAFDGI